MSFVSDEEIKEARQFIRDNFYECDYYELKKKLKTWDSQFNAEFEMRRLAREMLIHEAEMDEFNKLLGEKARIVERGK